MSWDTQVRFARATTEEQEDQFFELLDHEFKRIHVHVGEESHGLVYISRSEQAIGLGYGYIYAPCHWDFEHTQQTEKDLHLAADCLEIRIETHQSGSVHCTDWASREVVMAEEQVFHW